MIFSTRNLAFFFASLSATTTSLAMASPVNIVDNLSDIDYYRATNPRPPFHDDADMLNMVLETSLKTSILKPDASPLVPCDTLSIQELDERLLLIESLKSKELDSMYSSDDYRKNPYSNIGELQSKIENGGFNNGSYFEESEFQKFLKCRELVTSYVHRLSQKNKVVYLETMKSLPKLSEIDNEVRRRTLEEEDRRQRLLCVKDDDEDEDDERNENEMGDDGDEDEDEQRRGLSIRGSWTGQFARRFSDDEGRRLGDERDMGRFEQLRELSLVGNNLTGTLAKTSATIKSDDEGRRLGDERDMGRFEQLRELSLVGNNLTGTLPKTSATIKSDDEDRRLGDERDMGRLEQLRELSLVGNALTGTLPKTSTTIKSDDESHE